MHLHSINNHQQSLAAILKVGKRQTEDLKVPDSIPGLGMRRASSACSLPIGSSGSFHDIVSKAYNAIWYDMIQYDIIWYISSMMCYTIT